MQKTGFYDVAQLRQEADEANPMEESKFEETKHGDNQPAWQAGAPIFV